MTTYTVVNPGNLVDGQPQKISDVVANFNAVATVFNGNIDDSNINPSSGIGLGKIATLIFTQGTAAASWTIAYNMGKFPSVDVVDSSGNELWPDIDYTDANKLYWWNSSAWIDATGGGTPADATTSSKGIVQLAGDLAGTAASPQ